MVEMTSETLGKYEIRGVLGKGAMGTVYSAWDPVISRRVAIKTVRLPDAADIDAQEELARFKREAQAAGRLTHPNIVGIYDYGETSTLAYIVMEFVDGRTLKQVLDGNERLTLPAIGKVMADLLTGLQFSHARGVVHRDIKPANIMIVTGEEGGGLGQAKIADFGIARIESSNLTQAGTIMGTPAYMSPEQFMGQTVDARTDIYSSGVLLFQMLTGERPFEGSMASIMHKALNTDPPRPSDLSVNVPRALDPVVARAMARRPEDRFASAEAFAQALRAAFEGSAASWPTPHESSDATVVRTAPKPTSGPSARPSGTDEATAPPQAARRSKAPLLAGVAVVVLASAGAGAYFLMQPTPPPATEPSHPVATAPSGGTGSPSQTASAVTVPTPPPSPPTPPPTTTASNPAGQPAGSAAPARDPGTSAPSAPAGRRPPANLPPLNPAVSSTPQVAVSPPPSDAGTVAAPATVPSTRPNAVVTTPTVGGTTAAAPPLASPGASPPPVPVAGSSPPSGTPGGTAPPLATVPPDAAPPVANTGSPPSVAGSTGGSPVPVASSGNDAAPIAGPTMAGPTTAAPPTEPHPVPPPVEPPPNPVHPPASTQLAAAGSAPEALRDAVATAVRSVGCSVLHGTLDPGGLLTVQGTIVSGAPVQNALRDLHTVVPPAKLRWSATEATGPYCGVLDAVRGYASPLGASGGASGAIQIMPKTGRPEWLDGEVMSATLAAPTFPSYLQLDYFTRDDSGERMVLHVLSATGPSAALSAGERRNVELGKAGSPFGTDVLVAIASSVPLFNADPPQIQKQSEYLPQLEAALDGARARDARISADTEVVRTRKR